VSLGSHAVLLLAAFAIPPGQEALVGRMLGGDPLPGGCRFDGAAIEPRQIVARFACDGASSPLTIELVHASLGPPAAPRTARFTLLTPPGAAPPAGFLDALAARMRREEGPWEWTAIEESPAEPPRAASRTHSWAIAALLIALPVAVGAALGGSLRRLLPDRVRTRRAILALLSLALVIAPPLVLARRPWISVYDPLLAALLGAAAAAWMAWPERHAKTPRTVVALSSTVLLASLGCAEAWVRARAESMPKARPRDVRLWMEPNERDHRYGPLFPDEVGGAWFYRYPRHALPSGEGKRRIVHLGDSMLESADVPSGTEATALLEERRPGEVHYNLGISATGPDVYLAVLRRWIDRIRPDEVVVHVFPGNDVTDIDRPFLFCDGGPLLDASLASRCTASKWYGPPGLLFLLDPPPFSLRLLAERSDLAAAVNYAWQGRIRYHVDPSELGALELRLRDIVRELASIAARRAIPLTVVALPVRPEFFYEVFVPRQRVVDALVATGARVLDAAPAFEAALQEHPDRRLFQASPRNPHFDVDGQALYADWLESEVWGRGRAIRDRR
jgi:hypothetical protein